MFADLLPCPFCGGKALHMTNPLGGMDFWVTCEVCSASTTVYEGKNASVSAYQAWNRRTNTMEAVQPAANIARDEICRSCRVNGEVTGPGAGGMELIECPTCNGTGKLSPVA